MGDFGHSLLVLEQLGEGAAHESSAVQQPGCSGCYWQEQTALTMAERQKHTSQSNSLLLKLDTQGRKPVHLFTQ